MADSPASGTQQLVELRSYALVPRQVTAFVGHFEDHLVDGQEALGMDIVGQFRVPGDDARFVWIRRYLDPAGRAAALTAFYGGSVWKEFGPRANELMVDHTDVHLLIPDPSGPLFAANHVPLARRDGPWEGHAVVAAIYDLAAAPGATDGARLPADTVAAMDDAFRAVPGGEVNELGRLVTADVANDFPALPVHEDGMVAVWLLSDRAGGQSATAVARAVAAACHLPLQTTDLTPTTRSTLR